MSSVRRTPTLSPPPSPTYSSPSRPLNPTTSSSSSTTTTSHHFPPMSDEDDTVLPPTSTNTNPTTPPSPSPSPPHLSTSTDLLALPPPPLPSTTTTTKTTSFPIREDCWSEEATHTLIEAWGSHYLDLNRGNLRQKHWQEVADAVNAVHAHTKKLHRTDVQCKNRIDTLKKKYKLEKSKALQSNGRFVSSWPFFQSLDSLIGDSFIKANAPPSGTPPLTRKNSLAAKNSPSPSPAPLPAPAKVTVRKEFPMLPPLPSAVPVGPRSKRPAPAPAMGEDSAFRRNFSAMAAAAAAVAKDEDESDTSSAAGVGMGMGAGAMGRKKRRSASGKVAAEGYRKLAEAIGGFAEIYERVEEAKQKQMVELEKQRMQFAKDLEIQRMKLFMESQVQLEKLKLSKRNSQSGELSCAFVHCFFQVILADVKRL